MRSRLSAFVLAAVAVAAIAMVYAGAQRTETGPAAGEGVSGTPMRTFSGGRIRVATWNIDGGRGLDGQEDLGRCAAEMRGFDLIGLNEVHGCSLTDRRDQAQILGDDLHLGWLFAPTERRWWHDDFGNALLTSLPVDHWERVPISTPGLDANRNLLLTKVRVGTQIVNVVGTHISRHSGQAMELRGIVDLFLRQEEPALLFGDLNATDDAPEIQRLLGSPGVTDAVRSGMGARAPKHVEWIVVRGLRCIDAGIQATRASDHPIIWANLEVGR
ncbi:MAG: Endonuclease/exonuclease/phosphatase [Phycisphaerales bacterium]|nr:Endonuclease/exonuclease/phosphatase [Phycisphaerales bacterium]